MHPSPGDYLLRVARLKHRDPVHSHHPGGLGRECNVVSEQELEQLQAGKLGPYKLWQTLLPHSRRAETADLHRITVLLSRSSHRGARAPDEPSHQEGSGLLCAYRRQSGYKRTAYRALAGYRTLDRVDI